MRAKSDRSSKQAAAFATDAGIAALAFLAEDEERLSRFLALSGLGPHNLREAAAQPTFLGAVLEYLAECKIFWKMNRGKVDEWIDAIRAGGRPDFGPNLNY